MTLAILAPINSISKRYRLLNAATTEFSQFECLATPNSLA